MGCWGQVEQSPHSLVELHCERPTSQFAQFATQMLPQRNCGVQSSGAASGGESLAASNRKASKTPSPRASNGRLASIDAGSGLAVLALQASNTKARIRDKDGIAKRIMAVAIDLMALTMLT
jgi:hypothetical protein